MDLTAALTNVTAMATHLVQIAVLAGGASAVISLTAAALRIAR